MDMQHATSTEQYANLRDVLCGAQVAYLVPEARDVVRDSSVADLKPADFSAERLPSVFGSLHSCVQVCLLDDRTLTLKRMLTTEPTRYDAPAALVHETLFAYGCSLEGTADGEARANFFRAIFEIDTCDVSPAAFARYAAVRAFFGDRWKAVREAIADDLAALDALD